MKKTQSGFTLVEILMVLILVAVLAAVGVNAFINFRAEAQEASLQANLAALRSGINAQYAQMQLRCGGAAGVFPAASDVTANNITTSGVCTVGEVTIASERAFVQGDIPNSPYTDPLNNDVNNCETSGVADACVRGDAGPVYCDGTATATNEWCYNPSTGEIWLDSATAALEAL